MIELRRRYSGGVQSPSFSRLPKEYQEVEYLESTGQYIDLELSLPNGFIFESYVNILSKGADYGAVLGCHEMSAPYKRNYLTFPYINSNGYTIGCGDNVYVSGYDEYNDRVKIKASTLIGNNYLFINDNLYVENEYIGERSGRNVFLFASNNTNQNLGASQFFIGRIEDAKIYDEHEELVRHLIPCYRISDRKPGMYDIVNDVFYINEGTGEFLYGPDVHYNIPFEYQEVEWLKGDGNAYIKTNFVVNSEQEFEITFRIDDFSSIQMLLGISSPYYRLYSHSVGGTNQIEFQYQNNVWNQNIESGEKYIFKKVNSKYYLNNVELPIQLSDNFQSVQDFYIFSCHGELGRYESKNYIYIIKLHDRQFIPCYRKEDNIAGMYDLLSGEFYTNAGTGEFEVGPEVIG